MINNKKTWKSLTRTLSRMAVILFFFARLISKAATLNKCVHTRVNKTDTVYASSSELTRAENLRYPFATRKFSGVDSFSCTILASDWSIVLLSMFLWDTFSSVWSGVKDVPNQIHELEQCQQTTAQEKSHIPANIAWKREKYFLFKFGRSLYSRQKTI